MTLTGPERAVDPVLRDRVETLLGSYPDGALPIVQAGDPVLRAPAAPYTGQLGDLLEDLLAWMRATMLAAPGVGLAAPQVGVGLALAVVHDAGSTDRDDPRERVPVPHRTLVNPRYRPVAGGQDDRVSFYEGCLSVAGYQAVVARYRSVELTCEDESGNPVHEVLTGWPARIVQHETDHLGGVLYLDRAETRSLTSTDNLARYWARDPAPHRAGAVLGFEVAP